jgi:hypothetical protein
VEDTSSGQGGPLGAIADLWNTLPTMKGEHLTAVGKLSGLLGVMLASGALVFGGHVDKGPAPLCQRDPLHKVYKHERFKILAVCQEIHATIVAARKEHDGDYHVSVVVDEPGWTNSLNNQRQHGYTVVEFVPLMPKPDKFKVTERLKLTGTKVLDLQHGDHKTTGWIEMHPVFKFTELTDPKTTPKNDPKLAPPTEETK